MAAGSALATVWFDGFLPCLAGLDCWAKTKQASESAARSDTPIARNSNFAFVLKKPGWAAKLVAPILSRVLP